MLNSAIPETFWKGNFFFGKCNLISFAKQLEKLIFFETFVSIHQHDFSNTLASSIPNWLFQEGRQSACIYLHIDCVTGGVGQGLSGLFARRQHCIIVTGLPHVLRLMLPSFADLCITERTIPSSSALPIQKIVHGNSAPLQWSYFVTFCLLRL